MHFDVFNYCICLIEMLSISLFFCIIDNQKFYLLRFLLSYSILALGSILITFIDGVSYSILLLNFAIIFVGFEVGYRRSLKDTFFNALFSFLMLLYLQSITLLVIPGELLGTNWGNLMGDSFIIAVAIILNILSRKFHWAENYKNNLKLVWIFLTSLCLPTILISQYLATQLLDSSWQTITIFTLLQLVYLSVVVALFSILQHRTNSTRLKQTQKYIDDLNNHLEDSRKSMHDFNKHIRYLHNTVMLSSADNELRQNVDLYCKELINTYDEEEILLQLDDPILRALLYGRRTQAVRNGIDFVLDAAPVLPQFPMENFRLVEMFDNLMDNAFESVMQLSTSNKWIRVTLNCERYGTQLRHTLSIENPCENTDISSIVNEGAYTSKGGNHMGLGLKKVTRLVNDTGGNIFLSVDNSVFSVKVVYDIFDA